MSTSVTKLNNVNIEAVGSLAEKIKSEPHVAQSKWSASVEWKEGFYSEAKIREFSPISSDEPESLGGSNKAPNPVEQLLGALGNCLAVGYAANASAAGVKIDDLRVEVSGDLDLHTFLGLNPEGNAGFSNIEVKTFIKSDAPREKLEEVHKNVVATSPVGHTLQRAIPVNIALQ